MLKHVKLARVNTLLLVAIICINGYIILLPVLPRIIFWVHQRDPERVQSLEAKVHAKISRKPNERPQDNRLVVPTMLFDEGINEGSTTATLRKGLWHRPKTSSPDKGGNTVLVGHRLTYSDPQGTLYNLDKVQVGDSIAVWWQSKRYTYTVAETKVVAATQTDVEAPTRDARLTIYTCTPLWLPKDRLVVVAKLENVE